jgi:uncharacterized metal-binding protein YceD (DUF177 family)
VLYEKRTGGAMNFNDDLRGSDSIYGESIHTKRAEIIGNFDLPIKSKMKLIVRFGEEFNNDNEELLILPFGEFEVDIAQYIYEMIVLSVPLRRVHPGVKDGTLESEALKKLNELAVKETKKENKQEENIDPRWDKLKQLLTDK